MHSSPWSRSQWEETRPSIPPREGLSPTSPVPILTSDGRKPPLPHSRQPGKAPFPPHRQTDSRQVKSGLRQGKRHTDDCGVCTSTLIEVLCTRISYNENKVDVYSCVTLEIILNLSEPPFPLFTVSFMTQSNTEDCICWVLSRDKEGGPTQALIMVTATSPTHGSRSPEYSKELTHT